MRAFRMPDRTGFATFLFLFATGVFAVVGGRDYGLGMINRIGPGAFPAGIGLMLIAFSIAVLFSPPEQDEGNQPGLRRTLSNLRGPFFICAAMLSFMVLIEPFGLALTVALVTAVSAAADRELRPGTILLLAVGAAAMCTLVFIVLLRLPLRAFWW